VHARAAAARLRNAGKLLYPAAGFTKADVAEYYARVAPWLLPHLEGRAVVLRRFPEGIDAPGWYQTNCRGAPPWLRVADVAGRRGQRFRMCTFEDVASLLWAVELGTLEFHPFLWRLESPAQPTTVVFDLDPGPPADVVECCEVALLLRELLGPDARAKTSGFVGLHVYAPHEGDTRRFARELAATLAADHPQLVVDTQRRTLRESRVLVDWLQNDPARQTVAPYSLRAAPFPTVSTPVTWEEVERCARERRPELLTFTAPMVLERLERVGDVFLTPG
jgi:bifunctional non-homologous end joining protein LigD